jgi:Holliday junction resolvasome RuvABC ATP-dependent DNA helicase subunit
MSSDSFAIHLHAQHFWGVTMVEETSGKTGLELLIRECRKRFRIPENLNHYSAEDLREAEKKFLKLCLIAGSWRNLE